MVNRREPISILFVCSMNRWRSPTAEKIYAKHDCIRARSRGTSSKAVRVLSGADLKWADWVMVMESKHRQQILEKFPAEARFCKIDVLDIPDDYQHMDPVLVEMLQASVEPLVFGDIETCKTIE